MLALFAGSLAWLVYAYAIYPLWMCAWARVRPRPWRPSAAAFTSGAAAFSLSVIVPARDEQAVLARKIESLLGEPPGPAPREILVVDDGSRDRTAEVAEAFAARGVSVLRLARPSGKAAALNAGVCAARGEILVLTDARQPLVPGALAALIEPFSDARVGAVSGELALSSSGGGLGLYRRADDALRRAEAQTGSQVGVTGALWALRARLWDPLPHGFLVDDLLAPLFVARRGGRVVTARGARVLDEVSPDPARELSRRVRTLAGNVELVRAAPWVISPRANPLFFRLVGHKLSRLVAPAALAGLLLSSVMLAVASPASTNRAARALGEVFVSAQALGYALAALAPLLRPDSSLSSVARACRAFVFLHLAAALALWRVARGHTRELWRDNAAVDGDGDANGVCA